MDESEAPEEPLGDDRLNGWKEIAAFLGRGVRTVQRWEKDYGLPVRRVGKFKGEIIIASRRELSTWIDRSSAEISAEAEAANGTGTQSRARESATSGNQPSGSYSGTRGAGIAIGLVVLGLLWSSSGRSPSPAPMRAQVAGGVLVASGISEQELWRWQLPVAVRDEIYEGTRNEPGSLLQVHDLTGDGSPEVLVGIRSHERDPDSGLVVLNNDGTERFLVRPDDQVTFGDEVYGPPWLPWRIFVLPAPDGQPHLYAVFINGRDFATLLIEMDSTGRRLGHYTSNGYLQTIGRGTWNGRNVILAGGTSNETQGASLAILDQPLRGSSPAMKEKYRCLSCSGGAPTEFLLFPQKCVARAVNGQATTFEVFIESGGLLRIHVGEGPQMAPSVWQAGAWYDVGSDLTVQNAIFSDGWNQLHQEWTSERLLDHSVAADWPELFPVTRWANDRHVPLQSAVDTQ